MTIVWQVVTELLFIHIFFSISIFFFFFCLVAVWVCPCSVHVVSLVDVGQKIKNDLPVQWLSYSYALSIIKRQLKEKKTISGQRTPDSHAAGDQTWVNDMNLFFNRFDQSPTSPRAQPSLLPPTTSSIPAVYCSTLISNSLSTAFISQIMVYVLLIFFRLWDKQRSPSAGY